MDFHWFSLIFVDFHWCGVGRGWAVVSEPRSGSTGDGHDQGGAVNPLQSGVGHVRPQQNASQHKRVAMQLGLHSSGRSTRAKLSTWDSRAVQYAG